MEYVCFTAPRSRTVKSFYIFLQGPKGYVLLPHVVHQEVNSGYHNLGDTILHVYNCDYIKTSMIYLQLYLVGHSRLLTVDCNDQYLSDHSQDSDCHDQLLLMIIRGII